MTEMSLLSIGNDNMKIKIAYSNSKNFNGIKAYSLNLYDDLKKEINVKLKPVPKIEISIHKKRIGGWTSQRLLAWTVGKADIVHSTSHWDITPHTNVVTIHDLYPLVESEYFKTSQRAKRFYLKTLDNVQKKAKYIIVEGPHIAEQVNKYITGIPIAIVPIKIFVKPALSNPYPSNGKLHLVTMGEIHGDLPNRKQIYDIYDWIKGLSDVELYHIGRITDNRYIGYSANIHQLGAVSQQEKFNYLQYADKFVFKTIGEGQELPTMEAMRLNTQVVINDLPEHRYFLGDKPYYYHNKDEFLEMIWKPKKSGLVDQIRQYDNWIEKFLYVYNEVVE